MKKLLILIAIVGVFTSCQPSREKLHGRITAMENRLFAPSAQAISKESADSLIGEYELFVKDYPKDSLSPAYLFKAAGMSMNTGDGAGAITYFDRVVNEYPSHPKASLALFFKGYVQENILRNLGQAKETYLLFLEKYPDNEFADDAKASIENLGKTPEQMIREFEAKNKADSAAAQKKNK
jgi:outer membrane protein assembly factor BamD (BamD/ComL family)